MTSWAANKFNRSFLLALLFGGSTVLFGGPEPPGTDGKDYSKEVVPLEKNWCQLPTSWEIRIGVPAWLAGLSGDTGVKGLEASSDVGFDQILNHLTHFPIALSISTL